MSVAAFTSGSTQTAASPDVNIDLPLAPPEGAVIFASINGIVNSSLGTPPADWVNVLGEGVLLIPGDSSICMTVLYHIVTEAEATAEVDSWTLTGFWNVPRDTEVQAVALVDVDLVSPVADAGAAFGTVTNASNSTVHVLPGVPDTDVVATGDYVLRAVMADDLSTYTTPADHTQIATSNTFAGSWLGHRDALTTAGVAVAATNIAASLSGESAGITVIVSDAGGGVLPVNATDPIGITDAVDFIHDNHDDLTDTVGITDAVAFAHDDHDDAADSVGITDDVTVAHGLVREGPYDPIGITDTVSVLLVGGNALAENPVDPIGIADSVQVDVAGPGTVNPSDGVGIADSVEISYSRVVLIVDQIGITDHVVVDVEDSDDDVDAIDPIGITDMVVVLVEGMSDDEFVVDEIGITDVVSVILGGTLAPVTTGTRSLTDPDASGCCGGRATYRVSGDSDDTLVLRLGGVADLVGVTTVAARVWRLHHPLTVLAATVIDPAERLVRVELSPWLDTAAPGRWRLEVDTDWVTGESLTFPARGYAEVRVRAAAPV